MNFPHGARSLFVLLCASACATTETERSSITSPPSGETAVTVRRPTSEDEVASMDPEAIQARIDNAEDCIAAGHEDVARAELVSLIRGLLEIERMNPGDPRIDALFRASVIADRHNESQLASLAWTRILALSPGSIRPQDIHTLLVARDPIYWGTRVEHIPPPSVEPTIVATIPPPGVGGATGTAVDAAAGKAASEADKKEADKKDEEEVRRIKERVQRLNDSMSPGDFNTRVELNLQLAANFQRRGKMPQFRSAMDEARRACEQNKDADDPESQAARKRTAQAVQEYDGPAAAADLWQQLMLSLKRTRSTAGDEFKKVTDLLVKSLLAAGRNSEAQNAAESAAVGNGTDPSTRNTAPLEHVIGARAEELAGKKSVEEGRPVAQEIIKGLQMLPRDLKAVLTAKRELAVYFHKSGEYASALKYRREVVDVLREMEPVNLNEVADELEFVYGLLISDLKKPEALEVRKEIDRLRNSSR